MNSESRIVLAREAAGLSQTELASKLGIHPSTLNGYEKGNHDPKSTGWIAIAKICNVSVDYLLGLTDNPKQYYNSKNITSGNTDTRLQKIVDYYNGMNNQGQNLLSVQAELYFNMFAKPKKQEKAI